MSEQQENNGCEAADPVPCEEKDANSLQNAFKRFQRERKEEHRMRRRNSGAAGRADPERKQRLREQFVQTARKYMGVPYARKYHEPGTPEHDAPLFLDCCGLVRRVAWDMTDELGFRLGKWNQAYQIDTLPLEKGGVEQLQPGDLIFYSGTYFSDRAKPQKHDMVHVEIFVGGETGEATIGARWKKGKVQEFPSFRFESTSYHGVQHYFRSLDTWLEGECRSHCDEHPWLRVRSPSGAPSKYSVFNPEDGAESSDEEAAESGDDVDDDDVAVAVAAQDASESKHQAPRFYVNRSNGWRMVKEDLEARGWEAIPFEDEDDRSFSLRWVERRSQIDFSRHKPGKQLVNHIPNNDVITTKLGLLVAMRKEYGDASPADSQVSLDAVLRPLVTAACLRRPTKVDNFMLMQLYNGGGGGGIAGGEDPASADDVAAYMTSHIEPVTGPLVEAVATAEPSNVSDFCIGYLEQLVGGVAPADIRVELPPAPPGMPSFMPESYRLDQAADCVRLLRRHDALEDPTWIFKPTIGNRGFGLFVFNERDVLVALTQQLAESSTDHDTILADAAEQSPQLAKALEGAGRQQAIVQLYTPRPLLFDGRKFDIRMYALIARNSPNYVVYGYDEGYLRLSLVPYSLDDLSDRTVHLTNAAVQKKHASYKSAPGMNIKSLQELAVEMGANGGEVEGRLKPEMMAAMATVIKAGARDMERGRGFFDLLGFDFLITEDLQLQLLEVNTNPALHIDCPLHERILPALVHDTLDIVLETPQREVPAERVGGFSLLWVEA